MPEWPFLGLAAKQLNCSAITLDEHPNRDDYIQMGLALGQWEHDAQQRAEKKSAASSKKK